MDAVEREVALDVPAAEVWASLTEPRRLSAWLGGTVELDVRAGGRGTVRRGDGAVRRVVVEAVETRRRLALRWWPFEEPGAIGPPGPSSRVELVVEAVHGGTILRVIEWAPLPSGGVASGRVDAVVPWGLGFDGSAPSLQAVAR